MNISDLSINHQVLKIEREQLFDEGLDISEEVEAEFEKLESLYLEIDPSAQMRVQVLLDMVSGLPMRPDYPYEESSELSEIRAARPDGIRQYHSQIDDDLYDRIYGAWLGRCAGCLLGKPIEGW